MFESNERRLKMAKKKSEKKMKEGEHCEEHCNCKWISMKLAIIAFLLFLLTVWPGLSGVLLKHNLWGIYLAIFILAIILPMFCRCRRK
jgi:hypothetical protein